MTIELSERDLIELNAYLDDELSVAERRAFERRLAQEPRLRSELESLRMTVALMGMAQRVRAPRSFTLDPAVYGRPARTFWDRIGLASVRTMAAAGAMATLSLVLTGLLAFGGPGGIRTIAQGGAMAPAPAEEQPVQSAAETGSYADAAREPAASPAPSGTLAPEAEAGMAGAAPTDEPAGAPAEEAAEVTREGEGNTAVPIPPTSTLPVAPTLVAVAPDVDGDSTPPETTAPAGEAETAEPPAMLGEEALPPVETEQPPAPSFLQRTAPRLALAAVTATVSILSILALVAGLVLRLVRR
jgi:anti-sigma factor RsiW